jgi:hypothetical protein
MDDGSTPEPVLRVVAGAPTAEELAALVAVLARAATPAPPGPPSRPSPWVRSARPGAVTGAMPAARGPHQWRASALPR